MLDKAINIQKRLIDLAHNVGFHQTDQGSGQFVTLKSEEPRVEIYVIGEFGRGKSSLINAIILEPLLPTDTFPTETHVWIIGGGSEPRLTLKRTNREVESDTYNLPQQVSALKKINQSDVEEVLIALPQFPLPEKTYLIEIPGLGDINPVHGRLIDQFLVRASAVIFVLETPGPLSESEARLLTDIHSLKIPLFVYLSGASGRLEADVAQTQRKIDEIIQIVQPEIPIFFSEYEFPAANVLGLSEVRQHLNAIKYSEKNVLRRYVTELEHLQVALSGYLKDNLPRKIDSPASRRSLDPQDRKRDLLFRMVEDQCKDIHTTFHEHTEALAYTLRNQGKPAQVNASRHANFARQLKFGLDDVRTRMEMLSENISNQLDHKDPIPIGDFCDFEAFLLRVEGAKIETPTDYRLIKYGVLALGTLLAYFVVFFLTSPFLLSPLPYLPTLCGSLSGLIVFGIIILLFRYLIPSSAGNEMSKMLAEANQLVETCTLNLRQKLVDQVGKEFGQKSQFQQPLPEKNNFTEALSTLDELSHEIEDLRRFI